MVLVTFVVHTWFLWIFRKYKKKSKDFTGNVTKNYFINRIFIMAASAKMSFNYYQNGKYGTLPANPQKDVEVTNDMHLKMSKKIAQLTKVPHICTFPLKHNFV